MKTNEIIEKSLSGQTWAHVIFVLGTIGAIVPASFNYALQDLHLSQSLATVFSLLTGIAAGKVVDGGLKTFLPAAIAWILRKKDQPTGVERRPLFNWLVAALAILMLTVSTYLNLSVTPDVVQMATGEANTAFEENKISTRESIFKEGLIPYQEATALAKEDLEAEKAAQAQRITDAQQSKGPEMYRLVKQGNGWAKGEVATAVRKAQRTNTTLLAKAQKKYDDALARQQAFIENESKQLGEVTQTAQASILSIKTDHAAKQGRWNKSIIAINIFSLIGFILFTTIIVLWEVEEGKDASNTPTLKNVAIRASRKAQYNAIDKLRKFLNLDNFVLAPALAAQQSAQAFLPTKTAVAQNTPKTSAHKPAQSAQANVAQDPAQAAQSNNEPQNKACANGNCAVVYHKKTNGETIAMRKSEVKRRLIQSEERLRQALAKGSVQSANTNQKNVAYWMEKLDEFDKL